MGGTWEFRIPKRENGKIRLAVSFTRRNLSIGFCRVTLNNSLIHLAQHFLIIVLSGSLRVVVTSIPCTNGILHVVCLVVERLYEKKHLFRFLCIESVVHCVALFALPHLQDAIAFLNADRCNLHDAARLTTYGFRITLTFYLNNRADNRSPVKRAFIVLRSCRSIDGTGHHDGQCNQYISSNLCHK